MMILPSLYYIYYRWTSLSLCGCCRSYRTCYVTYSLWKVCITSKFT
jgi:hypothetical protein